MLLGFAVASLFDDFSSLPALMVVVVTLAAWSITPAGEETARAPSRFLLPPLVLPAILAALALLVMPSVVGVDLARSTASEARDAAVRGDWAFARDRFSSAVGNHPEDAGYWLGLALARAELGDNAGAREAYATARRISPGDARGWAGEAVLTADVGVRIRLLTEAARRTTSDPTFAFLLGDALESAGRSTEAIDAYATAVAISSDLVTQFPATSVNARPARPLVEDAVRRVLDRIASNAAISRQAVLWNLALSDDQLPPDAGAAWRAIDLARKGNAAAADAAADEARQAAPYDAGTLAMLLALDRLTCQQAAYERVASWLGAFRPQRPAALAIIREHVYREDALSSYLPRGTANLPPDERWPWPFIGEPPTCSGWASAPTSP